MKMMMMMYTGTTTCTTNHALKHSNRGIYMLETNKLWWTCTTSHIRFTLIRCLCEEFLKYSHLFRLFIMAFEISSEFFDIALFPDLFFFSLFIFAEFFRVFSSDEFSIFQVFINYKKKNVCSKYILWSFWSFLTRWN